MSITVSSRDDTSETSPLLGGHQNGGQQVDPENAQPAADDNDTETNEIALAEEPSTKKLVAIMGAIWLGVFFAALGTYLGLDTHSPAW